ncbi:hypothetical protein Hanom_Chr06g00539701 [Helianthus anomalus]
MPRAVQVSFHFSTCQKYLTNFGQLTREICHVGKEKATTLSKNKRHAVSLVNRTITHTACRFLYTLKNR